MAKNIFDLVQLSDGAAEKGMDVKIEKVPGKDIAVIGMGVKFPLAANVGQLWHNLREGVDCIGKIPEQRKKDVDDYFRFMKGEQKETALEYEEAAYLEEIDKFDYRFFRLSPQEARLMDPNQRLFLETAWAAVEDAGYGGQQLVGSRTGVYVGFGGDSEYRRLIADVDPSWLSLAVPGNLPPIIASRLSYLLDLKGPSMLVNTVCSSSLLAVHLACQGIRNGECDLAVAGGVQTYVLPIRQARVGIESSDFKTKTFDHHSDGTGSGEGVAAVLLKPLSKALKDGDHIYAVIKGGAVNQDGRSIGISAPNPAAQEDVITRAWKDANIEPETISYIEAHGTGTTLGDPIEIQGIQRAFARYTEKKQFCAIGSVKTNMGHLDNSAGIAGLIKAVLALKNKEIPPSLHFSRPNRKIPFHKSPVYVNDLLMKWETNGCPRRCGVSSFSFSGTNCHLVLEEAPAPETVKEGENNNKNNHEILALSAGTREGLNRLVHQYKQLKQEKQVNFKDLCYTANTGRGHYNYRLALVLKDQQDFEKKIDELDIKNLNKTGIYYGVHRIISQDNAPAEMGSEEMTRDQVKEMDKIAREKLLVYKTHSNNKKLLHQLCELYIKGAEIDWAEWYDGQKRKRVSLPTYPFVPERCWLPIPKLRENQDDNERIYYTTRWIQEELTGGKGEKQKTLPGAVLILKDSQGIGEEIAQRLRKEGTAVMEVEVESGKPTDCEKLLKEPGLKDLQQVIHFQSLLGERTVETVGELETQLERGVYSLFHLTRALLETHSQKEDVDMVLISDVVHEVTGQESHLHPVNAALFGLGKVVSMENVNLRCRTIDIDDSAEIEHIIREIKAGYTEYKVAYRCGQRYVEEMTAVDITTITGKEVTIKSQGVYMITGGAGGLGLEIAAYLASQNKVNLALINRSRFPDRSEWSALLNNPVEPELAEKIKTIQEIEKKGSRVLCCSADVAREEEIEKVISALRNQFGKINGIIHCAAVGSGRVGKRIEEDKKEIFKEVMAPKVQGTWILDRLTREDKPDFFVVFSSPITLVGGIGSGSYTSANAYLDAFAAYRSRLGQKTMAMSWAPWENTVKRMNTPFSGNKHLLEMLSTTTIIKAFNQVLPKDIRLAVIGRLNYKSEIFYLGDRLPLRLSDDIKHRVKESQEKNELAPDGKKSSKSEDIKIKLTGRRDNQYSEVEKEVAQIFGQFLGYQEISIYDNFYELGGDSIIAIKIINTINKLRALKITATDLLKHPGVKDFAELLDKNYLTKTEERIKYSSIPAAEEKTYYEVSSSQRRIFLLSQKNAADTSWNISYAMKIEGELDNERFEKVFQELINRHETLRTSFHAAAGKLVQKVNSNVDFKINYLELNNDHPLTTAVKEESGLHQWVNENVNRWIKFFDLSQAPLLRVGVLNVKDREHLLIFDIHHIISDEISMDILVREMIQLYSGKKTRELKIQYKDFSAWQDKLMMSGQLKKHEEYWLNRFRGDIPVLQLPIDYQRPTTSNFSGEVLVFTMDKPLRTQLNALASETKTTLYWILMAVYNILLSKYTGQEDIVVGVLVDGRTHPQLENILGMFVNVLPLRNYPQGDKTFMEFLQEVKENLLDAYANQDYPFDELVDRLKIVRNINRNPLFDVSFQMHPLAIQEIELSEDVKFTPILLTHRKAKHDLLLEFYEFNDVLRFELLYSTELFTSQTIDRMINGFINIINDVVVTPYVKLKDIKVMTKSEKNVLLEDFNEDLSV